MIASFAEGYFKSGKKLGCTAFKGRRGSPTAFGACYRSELLAISGDKGGRQVMKNHPEELWIMETEEKQLWDVDLPEDLKRGKKSMAQEHDFSKGSIISNILKLALPMTLAQLINVLYNIIDRIYIGQLPEDATLSLTGLGLCLPIISIVIAFANLFGMGGAPLCSIERGRGNKEEAEAIMGNSFVMMVLVGLLLTTVGLLFKRPLLYLFGASDDTIGYADDYVTIYLLGNIFVMVGLGMNSFINSQGFGTIGMMTVLLGAAANILLDPVFIFGFHMGVQGAALATILSQFLSAVWILRFLTGPKATLRLRRSSMRLERERIFRIMGLGMSGFTMAITNSSVQIMYNTMLQRAGGDLYVGIMTVINSVREVISMPAQGVTNSAQPIMGYNYGAKEYGRVKKAIVFMSSVSVLYTLAAWGLIHGFSGFFIRMFNRSGELVEAGIPAMRIYFFGFFMMSLQFAGQSVFVGLGKSRYAVFFSIFRKVIIVIPLILILPTIFHLGTDGILMAEPISNFIGGTACFGTMLCTVWRELGKKEKSNAQET
ncbi:MAG: MATE family efflux transporter [Clostridium sp.]